MSLLSRGIEEIICVDCNNNCIKFIDSKSEELEINISVIKSDCLEYLKKYRKQFNFIFIDPPYNYKNYQVLVEFIKLNNLVKDEGCLIIEHDKNISFEDVNVELRKYGTVNFSIFSF